MTGSGPSVTEEQKREAAALSASPDREVTLPPILERLTALEARGELPPGSAQIIYQQAQLGLEAQERAADIRARESEKQHLQDVTTGRRRMGYTLLGFSGLGILGAFFFSSWRLHALTKLSHDFPQDRFWLLVGGQTVVTFFTLYFLYQLIKAAERMAMPYWWAERYPGVVRLMLGIEDMVTASSKSAEQVASMVAPLTEPLSKLVDATTRLLDAVKDKAKPGGTS